MKTPNHPSKQFAHKLKKTIVKESMGSLKSDPSKIMVLPPADKNEYAILSSNIKRIHRVINNA